MNKQEYEDKLKENKKQHESADLKALKDYLHSGIVHKVGDIIKHKNLCDYGIIKRIQYSKGFYSSNPEIVYTCEQLTKKMKKRVNYEQIVIYSSDAILIKVKS